MPEKEKNEKKIIIDEDWKQQAKREKDILAAQEQQSQKEKQARKAPLPKGDFPGLVNMLVTQALFALGVLRTEGSEKPEPDLQAARYHIDMLEALEEKTRGNLAEAEKKLLDDTINQVRLAFVRVAQ
jgi:hypothetical protein